MVGDKAEVFKNTDGSHYVRVTHKDSTFTDVQFPNLHFSLTLAEGYAAMVNGSAKVEEAVEKIVPDVKADTAKFADAAKAEASKLVDLAKAEASKLVDEAKAEAGVLKNEAEKLIAEAKEEAEKLIADAKAEIAKLSNKKAPKQTATPAPEPTPAPAPTKTDDVEEL